MKSPRSAAMLCILLVIVGGIFWNYRRAKTPEVVPGAPNENSDWLTYHNPDKKIRILYPVESEIVPLDEHAIRIALPPHTLTLAALPLPTETISQQEVVLTPYVDIRTSCQTEFRLGLGTSRTVEIGGTTFEVKEGTEGAAGTSYDMSEYFAMSPDGNQCYLFHFVLKHPTSLGVYYTDIPPGYEETFHDAVTIEKADLQALAMTMLESFEMAN